MRLVAFEDDVLPLKLRTDDGYRLHWEWGEVGEDGFYKPTLTVDYTDRLNIQDHAPDFGDE